MHTLWSLFRPLLRWFARRRTCTHLQVTLYTRRGCHLCDDVLAHLERMRKRFGFALTLVDVDTDAQLVADHGNCVPVVAVNGKVRFRGQVNPVLLRRLLEAEADRESSRRTRPPRSEAPRSEAGQG